MDICLDMEFEKSVDIMYLEIKRISRINPLFLSILEHSLIRINQCSYQKVFQFYKLAIYKTIDTRLPKFYQSDRKLPVIILTPNVLAHKSSFMQDQEFSNDGSALNFAQTYFKINMISGSNESLKFIKSIIESNNEFLFNTQFIQVILNEKWKKIRLLLYLQAIIYCTYLLLVSYFSVTRDASSLIAAFVISSSLILYEFSQFLSGKLEYFKDIWNYIDLAGIGLFNLLFFEHILSRNNSYENDICALVLFMSWIRGISYFRLSKSTRYYVNLIYEVIFDITPFLTILFYSTTAFGLIFHSIMEDASQYSYFQASWELNIGSFNTSGYPYFMYLMFFLNSLLNPIIMLNLLISIMSDTFNIVNQGFIIADNKELASMILEGELFYFWHRNRTDKHYLHICSNIKNNRAIVDPKFKKLKTKINFIHDNHISLVQEFNDIKKEIKDMKDTTEKKLDYLTEVLLLNMKSNK